MNIHEHHEELIKGISEEFKRILDNSNQAIYIYLDDIHKVCNKKFASLLGYKSPDEINNIENSFLDALVAQKSQRTLVNAYRNAMEKRSGSNIQVTWKKKSGKYVDTNMILVPISFEGHLFALHFIN